MSKLNGPVGVSKSAPEPKLRRTADHTGRYDGNWSAEAGAERAALSRLRIAANLSGGTQVREIKAGVQPGFAGWWFGLRLWRWGTKVADAVLSIRGTGGGVASAIEQFMYQADIDVARFAIVRSQREPSAISREVKSRHGVWYFLGQQEHRDLLPLGAGIDALLGGLGRCTRRSIRQTARRADELALDFSFEDRSTPLEIDPEVVRLAGRNQPHPVTVGSIAIFEEMLSYRPSTFVSRITDADGVLISLCRGFIQGKTAYLVYQMNDPSIPGISLAAFHDFKLIEELIALGAAELIFVMGSHQFKKACQVSTKDELITIRPSLRGLAIALILAVTLRRTRFGEGVKNILLMIARHWYGLPKAAFDHAVRAFAPGRNWARAITAVVGILIAAGAVGAGILMREGLGLLSYITAYPAFMVATYLGGAWTGLLTITLGGLGILYYVIPPYDSFGLERTVDIWSTTIYTISALTLWLWTARRSKLPEPA
jgi:Acetyltransferase (GNAT) domain